MPSNNFIDISGNRYGRLIVVDRIENDVSGRAMWRCICDCGNIIKVSGKNLRNGNTTSCGCKLHDTLLARNTTHGHSKDRLYSIWCAMKNRCYNVNDKDYNNYGGRGIEVCQNWLNDYSVFREWAYNNGYNENANLHECTIDRINVDKNYCPENCRWVDHISQCNNRRTNKLLTYNNETHTMKEWATIVGINYRVLRDRVSKLGWSIEKVLTTPKIIRR